MKFSKYGSTLEGKANFYPVIISSTGVFHKDLSTLIIHIVNQGFKGSYYDKEFHTPAEIIRLIKDDITIANAKGNAQIMACSLGLKSFANL